MRGRLVEVGREDLATSAVGAGIFAILLFAFANVDAAATEARAVLLGALGLVVAVMAGMHEETAPPEAAPRERQPNWYEYDGAFRGM